jgi:hypothetical protein
MYVYTHTHTNIYIYIYIYEIVFFLKDHDKDVKVMLDKKMQQIFAIEVR